MVALSKKITPISLGIIFLISAVLLFAWLDTVPGLHGDEAWVGLRANDIVRGDRPLLGMNGYTGSLHQYFAAFAFRFFGMKVWSLRFFGALTSLISVFLYYRCIRALANPRLALMSTLLLATAPFFSMFGRIANEVFMLNPIFALGAICFLLEADQHTGWEKSFLFLACGVLIGLGVWTHIIFLAFVAALGVAVFFRKKFALFAATPLYFTLSGFVLGFSPRILQQLRSSQSIKGELGISNSLHEFMHSFFDRLKEWPEAYLQIVHGDLLFQRFSGILLFHLPHIMSVLCVIGIAVLLFKAFRSGTRSFEALVLVFGFTLWMATALISPGSSERYFLLPLYLSPIFIAEVFQVPLLFQKISGNKVVLWMTTVCLIAITTLQLARTSVNYFHAYRESGGRISTFYIGGQEENSNHYIGTKTIYEKLVDLKAAKVCAEFLISTSLDFYKHAEKGGFDNSWNEKDCIQNVNDGKKDVYVVIYRSGARTMDQSQLPGFNLIFEDSHFIILTKKPAQTSLQKTSSG